MTRIIRLARPRETSGYECDDEVTRAPRKGTAPNFIDRPYVRLLARVRLTGLCFGGSRVCD